MFDCHDLAGYLVCPDDRRVLRWGADYFACDGCRRVFPIRQRRVLELLPSEPTLLPGHASGNYQRAYEEEFRRPLRLQRFLLPWGAPEAQPPAWMRKRRRQLAAVLSLLGCGQDTCRLLLCDMSAGAGLYSFASASYFRGVLHCDLCVDSLAYAAAQARREQLHNIVFLRIDYLRPPFAPALDRVLCLDSLIRGPEHERLLLRSLCASLARNGLAIVDFHNWWHNPLRRLGLLRQNFGECSSYTKKQTRHMLASLGLPATSYFGFVQEVDNTGHGWQRLAGTLLPATRLVYTLAPPSDIPLAQSSRSF